MGVLVDAATPTQKVAGGISMCLSFAAMVLGFIWGQHPLPIDENGTVTHNSGWLGGMGTDSPNWECTVHAVLMIFAMCFCFTYALVSYRVFHFLGHNTAKVIHGLWHVAALAIMITAIVLIIQFHNDKLLGHLSSFHSWMGLVTLALYSHNWILGGISFALPGLVTLEWKRWYMPSHRFLGIMGFFCGAVTMQTGIIQKAWLDGGGCIYPITSDTTKINPAAGYFDIPPGCRLSYGIGVLIILNALFSMYALWDFSYVDQEDGRKAATLSLNVDETKA
jgi:Eukaryotic cytochrome b561